MPAKADLPLRYGALVFTERKLRTENWLQSSGGSTLCSSAFLQRFDELF
jgi:hypothetical protein